MTICCSKLQIEYNYIMLKVVYAFFVGILLSIFVGVGIATFYSEPAAPTTPAAYLKADVDTNSAEFKQQQSTYVEAQQKYTKDLSAYNRNVSIIALVLAIVFMGIGLVFTLKLHVLSDGFLLGGVFTLMYSLARGFITEDGVSRFVIVTVGLVIALALGYMKFIRPEAKPKGKKRKP
jgi:hypothetical protein